MELKDYLVIIIVFIVTIFFSVYITMGLKPIYSYEVDTLCSTNESFLFRNDSGWVCQESSTGWAEYFDTQYTNASRFTILDGNLTNFPNNAGNVSLLQMPNYINQSGGYYNGTDILGREGDAYIIDLKFNAQPQANNVFCQFYYSLNGNISDILAGNLLNFPKGVGQTQRVSITGESVTALLWETDGAIVKVLCNNGDVEFWDISYEFINLHRAR